MAEKIIELLKPIVRDGSEMKTVTLRDISVGDYVQIGPVNVMTITDDGETRIEPMPKRVVDYAVRCGGLTKTEVLGMSMKDFKKLFVWARDGTAFGGDSD